MYLYEKVLFILIVGWQSCFCKQIVQYIHLFEIINNVNAVTINITYQEMDAVVNLPIVMMGII